jgi:hypothetical protein
MLFCAWILLPTVGRREAPIWFIDRNFRIVCVTFLVLVACTNLSNNPCLLEGWQCCRLNLKLIFVQVVRKYAFNSSAQSVGFVVDKIVEERVYLRVLRFSTVNTIPLKQQICIYSCINQINGDFDEHLSGILNVCYSHNSNAASVNRSTKIAHTTQTQYLMLYKRGASDVIQHIALNFPCSKRKHWRK